MKEKKRILNDNIRANKVQLINDEGENLGEISISEARTRAKENEMDLMEMGRRGDLTIVKMLDYGKFLYRQKKQERKNKAKGKAPDMKTIRLTFKIGEHDVEIKRKQAEKFGKAGHPLKVSLMLRGRENHYGELALDKMNAFVASLEEVYKAEGEVKRSGNIFNVLLKVKQQ